MALRVFLTALFILLGIGNGLSLVFTYHQSMIFYGKGHILLIKQLIATFVGLSLFFFILKVDVPARRDIRAYLLIIIVLLMIATLLLGPHIKGSRRWIKILWFSIEPSELAKPILIYYLAVQLGLEGGYHPKRTYLWYPLIVVLFITGLVVLQRDLSTSVEILTLAFLIFIASGKWEDYSYYLFVVSVILVLLGIGLLILPHSFVRLRDFVMYLLGYKEIAYQVKTALKAICCGGWFGKALFSGDWLYYIPDGHNDFVFSLFVYDFGIIGGSILLGIYGILFISGIKVAYQAENEFKKLLALGAVFYLWLQVVINIMSVLGIIPPTGVTLPFISYGGSAMIASLIAASFVVVAGIKR